MGTRLAERPRDCRPNSRGGPRHQSYLSFQREHAPAVSWIPNRIQTESTRRVTSQFPVAASRESAAFGMIEGILAGGALLRRRYRELRRHGCGLRSLEAPLHSEVWKACITCRVCRGLTTRSLRWCTGPSHWSAAPPAGWTRPSTIVFVNCCCTPLREKDSFAPLTYLCPTTSIWFGWD